MTPFKPAPLKPSAPAASIGVAARPRAGARRGPGEHQVWVLEDPLPGVSDPALAVAERLGVPFRRITLSWNWLAPLASLARRGSLIGLAPPGHERLAEEGAAADGDPPDFGATGGTATGPALILSAGRRAVPVALWLKARLASKLVQCMHAGPRGAAIDLRVMPRHYGPAHWGPGADPGVLPVLGVPHRLSPLLLHQTRMAWRERLAHLPRPCVALLVDGPSASTDMRPATAHALGQRVAALVRQRGGSVLAATGAHVGREATEALSAGLVSIMHVLHRWGEPGEDAIPGMLASAEAAVVTGGAMLMLSAACVTEGPVFIALPELAGLRQRGLHESFIAAGQARLLGSDLAAWPRRPLDEAGRIATTLRARFALD